MHKLLLAALVALASPTAAEAPNSTPYSDAWPPERFRGDNVVIVMFVDPSRIDEVCGPAPKGMRKIACQTERDGVSILAVPNPCVFPEDDLAARIYCHELAHSNQWPGTHGD